MVHQHGQVAIRLDHFDHMWPMMVSEVGRRISGSASSSPPPIVTTASSGEKLGRDAFLFDEALGDQQGNATFWWPVALKRLSSAA